MANIVLQTATFRVWLSGLKDEKAREGQVSMAANLDITAFDAADYLGSEEAQIAFLNDALASGHGATIANAIGAVARAKSRANGMGELAHATGIRRQTLNKSLSLKGNPTVETIMPVLAALGLRMKVERNTGSVLKS